MLRKNNRYSVVLTIVILSAITLFLVNADLRIVLLPAFISIIFVVWLWMTLWIRDNQIPFFDAGMFCALSTLIYTVYPLVNYWIDGMQFGILSDSRLVSFNITPAQLGQFHLRHVLYLFSFISFYSFFRGKGILTTGNIKIPDVSTRYSIFLFFFVFTLYFFLLQLITGVNLNATYESDSYFENMLAFKRLPLVVMQTSLKFGAILFIFKLALLSIVVSRCNNKKWVTVLIIWVIFEIVNSFVLKGSRTGLVMFVFSAALLYHRMIKPLSMKFLITAGSLLFTFFIFLGLYRSYTDFLSLKSDLSQTNAGFLSGNNEFQSLLGTAYDVLNIKNSGVNIPWYLSINDFIGILPPQQFMPFEKVPASEWYLRQIGLSGTGQGLMWGVISQSIVGFDWYELFFRGALLGYILAMLNRWYVKHQTGFLESVFYIFMCIKIYNTFRDTTFSFVSNIVWEILPFYLLLRFGTAFFSIYKVTNYKNSIIKI